jgi:predicted nucleic acid-binding protein
MKYIVDSCVWVDFFSKREHFEAVSSLLTDNCAFINQIILAEILPSARLKNEIEFIECLSAIETVPLNIDWDEIADIQFNCIKSGLNKVGLLDIAITQNAKQNNMGLFSTDKHIISLCQLLEIQLKI